MITKYRFILKAKLHLGDGHATQLVKQVIAHLSERADALGRCSQLDMMLTCTQGTKIKIDGDGSITSRTCPNNPASKPTIHKISFEFFHINNYEKTKFYLE